jgi:hypothetical protein
LEGPASVELVNQVASLGVPDLELAEQLLLQCRPEIAQHHLDLDPAGRVAAVEVQVVGQRGGGRVR